MNEVEIQSLLLKNYREGIKVIAELFAKLEEENRQLRKWLVQTEVEGDETY